MTRTPAAAVCLVATALALSACGAIKNDINPVASKAQTLRVALDGPANATHVGIYEAVANGDLRRAGLRLDIETPANSADALSLLQSGKVELAIVPEPELMEARADGSTTFGIGALVQGPTSAIVTVASKHSQITTVAGLKGKRVGVTGLAYQRDLLRVALANAGVAAGSVQEVDVGEGGAVSALLSGRVAAVYGGDAQLQAAALRARHKRVSVIPLSRAGVPNYDELVFVTRLVYFANHGNVLRRFVQAIGRGYAAVRSDPAAGVSALVAANPSLDSTLQAAALKAQLSSFFPGSSQPWGWQDQHEWNVFGRWMASKALIDGPRGWEKSSTNQLLAGQGP